MRYLYPLALMLALAACTSTAVASPTPSADESVAPTLEASVEPNGTLTLGDFGIADGPGEPIANALANAGADPRLVNGILLKDTDDNVWLCEALADTSTPQCDEPRLLVTNYPPDHEVVNGEDYFTVFSRERPDDLGIELNEEDGVRWVEAQQLFGVVEAAE